MPQPSEAATALVQVLRDGRTAQQRTAALCIWQTLRQGGLERADEVSAPFLQAGVVAALVHVISTSQDRGLAEDSADIIARLAFNSTPRADAVVAADGVAPLVQLVRSSSTDLQSAALNALVNISFIASCRGAAAKAEMETAGAIPLALTRLSSGEAEVADSAAALLNNLCANSPSRHESICSAGGIAALVRCLRRGSTDATKQQVLQVLSALAADCPERCPAIAAAGGCAACVELLARPRTPQISTYAATVVGLLAQQGQAAAVVAADPSNVVGAALERFAVFPGVPAELSQKLEATLCSLAAARQAAQTSSTAAAAAAPAPAAPMAAPAPRPTTARPAAPRACAAPGCGTTQGRLRRCGACGTVRYCSEACRDAHWREHRPECKRVCAERAAAEAAAGSGEAGPSRA